MASKTNYQETSPSLLPNNTTKELDSSPKNKPLILTNISASGGGGGGGGSGGGDRLKRDEWSEGAVSSLLEAYEAKWVLRNRAKLKGHDWEDVARFVSSRANFTKSQKTQTQCKNKIESMKKRYRSESATADGSSWPLYSHLDRLLRGSAPPPPPQVQVQPPQQPPPPPTVLSPQAPQQPTPPPPPPPPPPPAPPNPPLILLEPSPLAAQPPLSQPPAPPPLPPLHPQNSHGSNGIDKVVKEDGNGPKLSDQASDKILLDTDSSTPAALYSDKQKMRSSKKTKMEHMISKKKRRKRDESEIAQSIRWLAEVVAKTEQSRIDAMKELEKMRIEAEAKRSEIDLKRTEMIANTQLEIARLFAGNGKGIDSSLRIGRN